MSFNEKVCCSEKELKEKNNYPEVLENSNVENVENVTLENYNNSYCIPKSYNHLSKSPEPGFKIGNDFSLKNMRDYSMQTVESVKNIGNFIIDFAHKTNHSITNTAQNFKSNLAKSNFFDKIINAEKNTNFLKKIKQPGDAVAPWVGTDDEQYTKDLIISLSEDQKIFLRNPPEGTFEFNLDDFLPVAEYLLKEDPRLQKMRFELVPKRVKEEIFWRNYFYRIKLIQQSNKFMRYKHKLGLTETKISELSLEQSTGNEKNLGENVDLDDEIEINSIHSAQHEDSIIATQKEDSFEQISEKEIQELDFSYLNDTREEIVDKEFEEELEKLLQESPKHD
ncbi:synapse-associated protein 1 [Trichonephila clavipes]|uniref:Synapse-associated protein 1 n=1 Tax=Trichonephila clavipes TaxID=2585209 RepID=A0A8X7BHH5_TRICX|nr:synapse-associated protein 1 [Trichonephila clavipes]